MNTEKQNLIEAIKENVELIVKTNEMIELKQSNQGIYVMEQYQHQKTKLLKDLQNFYKELEIEASFALV